MTPLERAARALAKEEYPDQSQEWHDDCWPSWEGSARAVIEAIREPSMVMMDAGTPIMTDPIRPASVVYSIMIDALLEEGR